MLESIDFGKSDELQDAMVPFVAQLLELQDTVQRFHPEWLNTDDNPRDSRQRDRYVRISDFLSELLPDVCNGVVTHSVGPLLEVAQQLIEKQSNEKYEIQISAGTLMSHSMFAQLASVLGNKDQQLQEYVIKALTDVVKRMNYELDDSK